MEEPFKGSLFSADFVTDTISSVAEWPGLNDEWLQAKKSQLISIFHEFPLDQSPNEAQTEDDLIWPVLEALGWDAGLRQQNLSSKGRDDVPDGLLFENNFEKRRANSFEDEWRRYEFGLAIVESKRWARPLDRRSGRRGEETAPSTQMLRYLRRVDDITSGALRWGILTNGYQWRLYYQGARSVSEQFFELNLGHILGIIPSGADLNELSDFETGHYLRVFFLVFRQLAFVPSATETETFHQRAISEAKFYEERVASNLSVRVFERAFPELATAIAKAAPSGTHDEIRQAALVLLYRLLFIFYAEDRNLLPVRDSRYDDYGLRDRVRLDVGRRKDQDDTFSETQSRYWSAICDLCDAIDVGDASIGLPPYNGGLFYSKKTPILTEIKISDSVMSGVVDVMSFELSPTGRQYINYRDLSVQQLGSIYERLLEYEISEVNGEIEIQPNIFARRTSGSYYTPDDLVNLVISESVEPLILNLQNEFEDEAVRLEAAGLSEDRVIGSLKRKDVAERILDLKICDPAMGSGHFLVSLVDFISDRVITAMADAEALVEHYVSPLLGRIDTVRNTIIVNADERGWAVDAEQLDDRHIIRRMVLKRCVYGVDQNPMAVELAKVSLWLHTFTVGAPLSFLDHHLRCGNSLFGCWVHDGIQIATRYGSPLLVHGPVSRATRAASAMQIIEGLTDVEIAEAHRSLDIYNEVQAMTEPLNAFLSFAHGLQWLDLRGQDNLSALTSFFDGQFGDPIEIGRGTAPKNTGQTDYENFTAILGEVSKYVSSQKFFNWQVQFPGVWTDWDNQNRKGGFDAVIGNPPWDRIKMQKVEWFKARKPEIALATRASDRNAMIAELQANNEPLAEHFEEARDHSERATKVARSVGDYPLLSSGDVNLYSLFIERSMALIKPGGLVGLIVPSGIASDKTAAKFFKQVSTNGRLKSLFDFENRRTSYDRPKYFPDVDSRFKFCVFVAGRNSVSRPAQCAFFLQDVCELANPERRLEMSAEDFALVNPNTGTAPVFASRQDAEITTKAYRKLPILFRHEGGKTKKTWPLSYFRLFDMTNDSSKFKTKRELEEELGAYPVGKNRFSNTEGEWLPLYEGKMIQAFDHRAASVLINPTNLHRPAQSVAATAEEHIDPDWLPAPQYWVSAKECNWRPKDKWALGFKEITSPTNMRTFIAAILPTVGFGNKVPLLKSDEDVRDEWLLAANFNAIIFDFLVRQKIQGQTLNLYIVEQLPVVPPEVYETFELGGSPAKNVIRDIVLELVYTSNDLSGFAKHLGHFEVDGSLGLPFKWDAARRLRLFAKLNAIFFIIYGITNRETVRYIFSTFTSLQRQELQEHGEYVSEKFCLLYLNSILAGDLSADF